MLRLYAGLPLFFFFAALVVGAWTFFLLCDPDCGLALLFAFGFGLPLPCGWVLALALV